MTRARQPRKSEVDAALSDPRLAAANWADLSDKSWRMRGDCRLADPELFFSLPADFYGEQQALSVCRSCTVRPQCLADALSTNEQEGVRGGTTPRERRALLVAWRRMQAAAAAQAAADAEAVAQ